LGDPSKPKSWSKHSLEQKNKIEKPVVQKKPKEKKTKEQKIAELLEEHKGDVMFEEFMEAHLPEKRELWQKTKEDIEKDAEEIKKDADKSISDLDYLKKKKKKDETSIEGADVKDDKTDKIKLDRLTIKLSNLPCTVKKSDVKDFLKPAKMVSVRIPVKMKGIAYCDFENEAELRKALVKNRSFMGKLAIVHGSLVSLWLYDGNRSANKNIFKYSH